MKLVGSVVGQVNCDNNKFRLDSSVLKEDEKEFAGKWYSLNDFAKAVDKKRGFGGELAKSFYEIPVTEACKTPKNKQTTLKAPTPTTTTQTTLRNTGLTAASCDQLKPGLTSAQVNQVLGVAGKPMVVGGGSQVLGEYTSEGKHQGEFFWTGNGSLKVEYDNDKVVDFKCFLQ